MWKNPRTSLHILSVKKKCEISRIHSAVAVFPLLHHCTPSKKLLCTGRTEFIFLLTSGLGLIISGGITMCWEFVFLMPWDIVLLLGTKQGFVGLLKDFSGTWFEKMCESKLMWMCSVTVLGGWKWRHLPPSQHLAVDSKQRFNTKNNLKDLKIQILGVQ